MAENIQTQTRPGTFSAMRSSNFRVYFAGQLVSISGTWMQNLAQGFLIFNLTKSNAWLGLVACAAGIPVILLSPIAGVIVERVPRRRLLLFTQTAQMVLAFVLATLTFANLVQVWHIMLLAFLLGATTALDLPARQTFVVEMVGPEDLPSGIALNSVLNSAARVLGPTAAGFALVQFGPAWCFLLNGLSFLAVLVSLFFMDVPYAIKHIKQSASALQQLKDGVQFSYRHLTIGPLLLLTVITGFFIIPIIQFLPALADVVLHSPKTGYAILSTGEGFGSVIAGITIGWLALRFGYGRIVSISVVLCAITSAILALQSNMVLATIFSVLSGVFMIYQFTGQNIMLQALVPDQFRGRVMALYTLAIVGAAPFGSLLLGFLANQIGTANGVCVYMLIGGLLSTAIMVRWPAFIQKQ